MAKRYYKRLRGRRNQTDFRRKKRRRRIGGENSDSSDEDFVLNKEEEDDENESTSEDEVNESDEEEEAESTDSEDSDEDSVISMSRKFSKSRSNNNRGRGMHGTSKQKPRNQSTKRVKISSSDDEDFDPNYMSSTTDDEELVDDDNEEYEEFAKSRRKRKQRRKPRSSEGQKSRKRKKAPVSKKSSKPKKLGPVKIQRETARLSQRSTKNTVGDGSESDEDFVIFPKQPVKRQRKSFQGAETGRRTSRKRKLYNTSCSNSSCSDSDYIISEDDDELSYRPHRLNIIRHSRNRQEKKYTFLNNIVFNKDEEALRNKGKEKIDKSKTLMDSGLAKPVCGICLSDEGKAVRGKLNCCDHYFCFVCIMEWAKVESRCPMCKQRFSVISKSSKSGKGLRGTSVKIPVRDQVYQPSEEEIMGFLDPYANIVCLECNEAGDDGLLMLCDLCDSPHHTYCVGLGRVVPEGDWYCQACQTSMPTQSNTEEEDANNFVLDLHDEDDGLTIRELVDGIPVDVVGAESINLDLTLSPPFGSATVRETRPSNVRTIRRRMLRRSTPYPSPVLSETPRASVRQTQLFGSPSQVSSAGARTLSGQRRLQRHIHALRDNLSAQERASEQFSPDNLVGSNSCIGDRDDAIVRPTFNNRSRLFYESTRSNLNSSRRRENASGDDDIDRAWSLMEESRALAGGNIGIAEDLTCGRYCQGSSSANSKDNARPSSILGTSPCDAQTRTRNWRGGLDPATINSRGHSGRSMEDTSHREIGSNVPSPPSVLNRRFCPFVSERNESPNKRFITPVSFGSQPGENRTRKVEGAKDQVRTMVKAYVKKLTAGKEIDKLVFKDIARSCTHTVLAACGIDHSSHMVQPFERVSCYHTNQVQPSELMPGCCSHCFDLFIKDLTGNMVQQKFGISV